MALDEDILGKSLAQVRSYLNLKRPRQAHYLLNQIPTQQRTDDRFGRMEVQVYLAMEDFARALEVANELQANDLHDPEAAVYRAWSLLELGKINAAQAELSRGLEGFEDHAYYHYVQARVHRRAGRDEEALASLSRAIELDPDVATLAGDLPGTAQMLGELR